MGACTKFGAKGGVSGFPWIVASKLDWFPFLAVPCSPKNQVFFGFLMMFGYFEMMIYHDVSKVSMLYPLFSSEFTGAYDS